MSYLGLTSPVIAPGNNTVTPAALTQGGPSWDTSSNLTSLGVSKLGASVAQASPNSTDITSGAHTLLGGQGGNYLAFGQYGSGTNYAQWIQSTYQNPTTATYNLVLNPLGGNVGIGTNSPSAKLDVAGNRFRIGNATSDPGIELFNGSIIKGYLFFNTASDVVSLRHSSGAALNMDSLGRAIISYSSTSSLSAVGCYNETTGSGANMVIASNGFIIRSTSSLKYKKNVQDATYGLVDVMRLRAVTYESKNDNEAGVVYGGLIAEEVHEQGLTHFVQYADDGTPDAISYGNMVSLAFKAIQEQQAMITSQSELINAQQAALTSQAASIAALTERITTLEGKAQ